jgi:hypothetical protein
MDFGWKTNAISKNGSHIMTFFTYTFIILAHIFSLNFYLLVTPLIMNYMMAFLLTILLLTIGFTLTILTILTFIYNNFKLFKLFNYFLLPLHYDQTHKYLLIREGARGPGQGDRDKGTGTRGPGQGDRDKGTGTRGPGQGDRTTTMREYEITRRGGWGQGEGGDKGTGTRGPGQGDRTTTMRDYTEKKFFPFFFFFLSIIITH